MRHSYKKIKCKTCGRSIGANNIRRHERTHMTKQEKYLDEVEERNARRAFDRAYEIAKKQKRGG